MKVTNKNGKETDVSFIDDLWHLGMWLKESGVDAPMVMNRTQGEGDPRYLDAGEAVLKVWHQAHAMRDHIQREG